MVEHGLVQVRGHDGGFFAECAGERARKNASARAEFENAVEGEVFHAGGEVLGVGFEEERYHVAVVEFGDGAGESGIMFEHKAKDAGTQN